MKSQEQAVANFSALVNELSKYENRDSDILPQLNEYAHTLNAELKHIWHNTSPCIGPVGEKEMRHMTQYCKCRPNIKYLIFDYPRRFAANQQAFNYRLKVFEDLGVKVVFLHENDIPIFHKAYDFVLRVLKAANHA